MSTGVVLCGVPREHCTGYKVPVSSGLGKDTWAHGDRASAFRCKRNYLVKVLGYTQVGNREFSPPDGGPILVLTKKIRFGGRLRKGKRGTGHSGTRDMPAKRTGGLVYSV